MIEYIFLYNSIVLSAILSHENSFAFSRAVVPIFPRNSLFCNKITIFFAKSSTSPHSDNNPVFPSSTMYGIPPTFDATTGLPHAIASGNATGALSFNEGKTNKSVDL